MLTYPRCSYTDCTGAATISRTVGHTYNRGFLTAVPGFDRSITYHPNQTVSQVAHQNSVQWNQAMDPNGIGRPLSISTVGATLNWSSGTYTYDGAGNVTKIGGAYFLYDTLSRPKTANLYASLSGAGLATQQSYTYDNYANLTTVGGINASASATTNRLTGMVTYDAAGNLISWNNNLYDVDAFGMMWRGAQIQLNNIAAAGGPGRDPDFRHHQKEIKAILERASKIAKRLPDKLQKKLLRKIDDIADEAGVRLAK